MSWPASIVRRLSGTPRWVGVALCLGWAALIFFLSARPPAEIGVAHSRAHAWLMNLSHAPEYGVLALFFLLATSDRGRRLVRNERWILVTLGFVLAYALSDEYHQSFTPGRDASVCDIITDVCGAWLCIALVDALEQRASSGRIARILGLGIPACLVAAAVATFVPEMFPSAAWL